MKRILPIVLILALLLAPSVPASAESSSTPKEEVVYGILGPDGSVNSLYVVNIFEGGEITDYGNYTDVRNMSTSEPISKAGDKITINTHSDRFYYQGTLENKELPWNIDIKYYLDEKEIPGADLGGKSGRLRIRMSVKRNDRINSFFFDNYALQIALSLDNKLCSNIKADNATIAEAGSKKQLTYTVLPGNGIDFTITADVRDFKMDPITLNGIRLALDINIDPGKFTKQISDLTGAIKELDDGADELLDGLNQVSGGMQKYVDGMKAFKDGLEQLSAGVGELEAGAASLKKGLSELARQKDPILSGALSIQKSTFDAVNAQLGGMGLNLPVLTPENYSTVLTSVPELATIKHRLDGVVQFTQGLSSFVDGVSQLDDGASELVKGISGFKASSESIAASANNLYNAAAELNAAVKKLRDGLASYKAGTSELKKGTSNLDSEINDRIDEILAEISGGADKVISFVSEKNANVSAVQFALKTEPINPPETQKTVVSKPARLSFWQKLLRLFGLYI